jgi:hypothetical protein
MHLGNWQAVNMSALAGSECVSESLTISRYSFTPWSKDFAFNHTTLFGKGDFKNIVARPNTAPNAMVELDEEDV